MLRGAQAYLKTQVSTVSKGELLLLLYSGAIKFLRQAKIKMAEKDYAQKGILISRAMDVISELDESLNTDKGGDISQRLHDLYFFCNTRLLRANMDMNPEYIDDVIRILDGLRGSFAEIQGKPAPAESEPAPAPRAPAAPRAEKPQPSAPEQPEKAQPKPKAQVPKSSAASFEAMLGTVKPPTGSAQANQLKPKPTVPQPQPAGKSAAGTAGPKLRLLRPSRKGMPGTYGPSGK